MKLSNAERVEEAQGGETRTEGLASSTQTKQVWVRGQRSSHPSLDAHFDGIKQTHGPRNLTFDWLPLFPQWNALRIKGQSRSRGKKKLVYKLNVIDFLFSPFSAMGSISRDSSSSWHLPKAINPQQNIGSGQNASLFLGYISNLCYLQLCLPVVCPAPPSLKETASFLLHLPFRSRRHAYHTIADPADNPQKKSKENKTQFVISELGF